MKKTALAIGIMALLASGVGATTWDAQLSWYTFTNFQNSSNSNGRTLDPAKTPRLSDNLGGVLPGLTLFYNYAAIPDQPNGQYSVYVGANQDVFDHTIVSVGLARRSKINIPVFNFAIDTTLGLGLGNAYRYTYRYNNQPTDYFSQSSYFVPHIIYSVGLGSVAVSGLTISVQYGGTISMGDFFHMFNESYFKKVPNTSTITSDSSPVGMAALSVRIGF